MAIDLETGETGNAWELFAKAIARQQKRWAEYTKVGLERVRVWKCDNFNRKISPTRFYKLMHNQLDPKRREGAPAQSSNSGN